MLCVKLFCILSQLPHHTAVLFVNVIHVYPINVILPQQSRHFSSKQLKSFVCEGFTNWHHVKFNFAYEAECEWRTVTRCGRAALYY